MAERPTSKPQDRRALQHVPRSCCVIVVLREIEESEK
jgi:hypothetical protein